jgi:hypothetical protein
MERGLAVVIEDAIATGSLPARARENAEAQLEDVRRAIAYLSDASRARVLTRRSRAVLSGVRNRVLWRRRLRSTPPPEVADAFPDLRQR